MVLLTSKTNFAELEAFSIFSYFLFSIFAISLVFKNSLEGTKHRMKRKLLNYQGSHLT